MEGVRRCLLCRNRHAGRDPSLRRRGVARLRHPAVLASRGASSRAGPTAETRPAQRLIMLFTSSICPAGRLGRRRHRALSGGCRRRGSGRAGARRGKSGPMSSPKVPGGVGPGPGPARSTGAAGDPGHERVPGQRLHPAPIERSASTGSPGPRLAPIPQMVAGSRRAGGRAGDSVPARQAGRASRSARHHPRSNCRLRAGRRPRGR